MAETKKIGSGDLHPATHHGDNIGESQAKKETSRYKPIFIALIILGVVGLGVAGVGLASLGMHQGWWSAGTLSNLSQIKSMIMMTTGSGAGILFLISGIVGFVKAQKKENNKESLFEDEPIETELKEIAFGFRTLKDFAMKPRDGYVIADNKSYDPGSSFRMAKAELNSFFKQKKRTESPEISTSDVRSISKYIQPAAQEYKIHLMPKPEHMEQVVTRLIGKMGEDKQLKQHVAQYKVLLGEKNKEGSVGVPVKQDSHGGYYPRIVLYAEGKEAGQAILNAVCELFPDSENLGDGIVPRDNKQVTSLIYYAHGSGDIKNVAKDCNFELFKEAIQGEYDLQTPNK